MKFSLVLFLLGLLLIGCNPVPAPAVTASSRARALTASPIATRSPGQSIKPSPTSIQLPYNFDSGTNDSCRPPYAVLPVSEGNDISEEEIVHELVEIWLRQYKQPDVSPNCRIAGYSIERVYDDPAMYTQALQPRGDFMRVVVFSVKLIQTPTDWIAFSGELDRDNRLHLSHVVAIAQTGEGYQMEFAYP